VLHVLANDQLGGTELMVAALVGAGEPGEVRHELATLAPAGPIAAHVGPPARSLGGRRGLAGASWRLARLLRSRDYDVVSAYGLKASVIARLLVRLRRPRPVLVCGVRALHVTEVERLDAPKARIAAAIERALSPLVDVYDSNSRAGLSLLEGLGVDRARLVHIPNGLDLERWPARPREPGGGPPVIVCAARFVERKRHQDLLHALALLAGQGRGFRAVLAGEGPRLTAMRDLARRMGLGEQVEFPGAIGPDAIRALLRDAAVACLPSTFEGMPGSVMEAMASGVAVVATDVPGSDELIVHGESGWLVPVRDAAALAGALRRLLDDPELRRRLGRGGRARMEECFSLDAMLSAKERLYRERARPASAIG
jgi:glycosyltransferase involved in cell wall biosynthesis